MFGLASRLGVLLQCVTFINEGQMKTFLFNSRVAGALFLSFLCRSGIVRAGDKEVYPTNDKNVVTEERKWRFSAGVMVRSIHTEFAIDPRAAEFRVKQGGSHRLFGDDLSTQQYADGSVFLGNLPPDIARQQGIAGFSGGQASNLRPLSGGALVLPGTLLGTATFHSTDFSGSGLEVAGDTNLAAAPYLKAEYLLHECKGGELSLFGQYAYVADSDHSSGNVQGGLHGNSYEFRYNAAFVLSPGLTPGNVFFNAAAANAFNPEFSPKPGNPTVSVSPITVRSHASIDLALHEFTLALGYTHRLWDRVHLTLAAGPTFNLFDYDYHSQSDLRIGGSTVATSREVKDSQAFRMGIMEQAGLLIDLDKEGRWFLEIFGRYNWVDAFKAGNNRSNVKVDASSFAGGIGLGIHF